MLISLSVRGKTLLVYVRLLTMYDRSPPLREGVTGGTDRRILINCECTIWKDILYIWERSCKYDEFKSGGHVNYLVTYFIDKGRPRKNVSR